jgi:NTE family protein
VTLLRERFAPDVVIAVNVMPRAEDISRCQETVFPRAGEPRGAAARRVRHWLRVFNLLAEGNVLDTFRRSLMSAQLRLADMEARRASIEVHPFFCKSTWYDFENSDLYIAAGRDAARQAMPRIRALITRAPWKGDNHETPAPHAEMGLLTV